ncbi:hypothetical protein NCCP1664_01970 [Zafaria cholistanensis]|uniref:Uncharacterized protein n=1 Tax=Zafaria cholistanensis TaxID=1682741 RepID=A0A5A7NLQ0_9MICC|nr:hypothetical protein NCCP1664_01970 [Zafaria cholistanensis]
MLLAAASANLMQDFRSLALLMGAVMAFGVARFCLRPMAGVISRAACLWVVAVALAGTFGYALAKLYATLVGGGYLDEQAEIRLELQGGGSSPLLMLLGGRNEIFYSLRAALEHPILGYGTEPIYAPEIIEAGSTQLLNLGLDQAALSRLATSTVPAHSSIMSSWLEAGILGLLAWVVLIALGLRSITLVNTWNLPIWVLPTFTGLLMIWTATFSPFGATTRFLTAATLTWALWIASNGQSKAKGA